MADLLPISGEDILGIADQAGQILAAFANTYKYTKIQIYSALSRDLIHMQDLLRMSFPLIEQVQTIANTENFDTRIENEIAVHVAAFRKLLMQLGGLTKGFDASSYSLWRGKKLGFMTRSISNRLKDELKHEIAAWDNVIAILEYYYIADAHLTQHTETHLHQLEDVNRRLREVNTDLSLSFRQQSPVWEQYRPHEVVLTNDLDRSAEEERVARSLNSDNGAIVQYRTNLMQSNPPISSFFRCHKRKVMADLIVGIPGLWLQRNSTKRTNHRTSTPCLLSISLFSSPQ